MKAGAVSLLQEHSEAPRMWALTDPLLPLYPLLLNQRQTRKTKHTWLVVQF